MRIGVAIDANFVEDLEGIKKIFDITQLPSSPQIDYLRQQNFSIVFIKPLEKPRPSKTY